MIVTVLLLAGAVAHARGGRSESLNIWEGTGCKAKVTLTPYLSGKEKSPAVIVCPGGSYFWHDVKTEGDGVARWLQQNGISAFVLRYRVGTVKGFITHYRHHARGNRYPDMLQDVQRSIELIRRDSTRYRINPNEIGVMGFSAGGHLSLMAGTFFDTDVLSAVGVRPEVSLRPDFIAPIYPVVSLSDYSAHGRSRRGILGEGKKAITPLMMDSLSMEKHVRADMPPVFLMNCVDDPIVKYRNSVLLDSALTAKGVNHVYIQYPTGGHGFGADPAKTSIEAIGWKEEFLNWLGNIFNKKS